MRKKIIIAVILGASILTGCNDDEIADIKDFSKSQIKVMNNVADNVFNIMDKLDEDEEFKEESGKLGDKITKRFKDKFDFFSEDRCRTDSKEDRKYFDIKKTFKENKEGAAEIDVAEGEDKSEIDLEAIDAMIREKLKEYNFNDEEMDEMVKEIKLEILEDIKEKVKADILGTKD